MKNRSAVDMSLLVFLSLAVLATPVRSQRTDLHTSIADNVCSDISAAELIDLSCLGESWLSYRGRVAMEPLTYVGPITMELDTRRSAGYRHPLYVEFLSVADHPPDVGFCDGPALIVHVSFGRETCAEPWETVGPLHLPVEIGGEYVIRFHFFGNPDSQHLVFIDEIKVMSHPETTTQVGRSGWASIKSLYR